MAFKRPRRLALIGVAAAALTLLATGWALATHFSGHATSIGKAQLSQTNQSSSTGASITSTTTFLTLNGTSTTVIVPAGQNRLVNARWVGEVVQSGNNACLMRIGAIKGATFTEFNPVSSDQQILRVGGVSGVFSTASVAVERSRVLGPGTYTVVSQVKKDPAANCGVDDWHFAVQVIAT